jgi:hypothetical protein
LPRTLDRVILAAQTTKAGECQLKYSGSEAAMTVKLYAFTCGTVTGEFAHLMEGADRSARHLDRLPRHSPVVIILR